MNENKEISYSYIRTEADNKITLFLKVEDAWLDKELDINLTKDKKLSISIANKDFYETNILDNLLYEHIATKDTLFVFCDNDANFLFEKIIVPLSPVKKNKI